MSTINIVIGIVLIIAALFLVVAVLLQSGKDDSLSGSITGSSGSSADSFFGKNKGKTADKILSRATMIVAIVFVAVVVVMYVAQDDNYVTQDSVIDDAIEDLYTTAADTTVVADTDATTTVSDETGADTTVADTTESEATNADTTVAEETPATPAE